MDKNTVSNVFAVLTGRQRSRRAAVVAFGAIMAHVLGTTEDAEARKRRGRRRVCKIRDRDTCVQECTQTTCNGNSSSRVAAQSAEGGTCTDVGGYCPQHGHSTCCSGVCDESRNVCDCGQVQSTCHKNADCCNDATCDHVSRTCQNCKGEGAACADHGGESCCCAGLTCQNGTCQGVWPPPPPPPDSGSNNVVCNTYCTNICEIESRNRCGGRRRRKKR